MPEEIAIAYERLRLLGDSAMRMLPNIMIAVVVWLPFLVIAFPTFTPGILISALGITGIAVGLAFKDIFENFLAGTGSWSPSHSG